MRELVARIRALLRRAAGYSTPVLRSGPLQLDTARMLATVHDRPVRLSPLEYRLLDILAHQGGRVLSAGQISEHLHGTSDAADSNAIEALVLRLRSEEHTSELQSLMRTSYAVFCLKKKRTH